jgi:chemotaxis protein CheD
MTKHHVGIGQVVASSTVGDQVDMLGLGSCVGVYFAATNFVVAAHCLLDRSNGRDGASPGKFVDTAIPHLLTIADRAGFGPSRLVASIAGGAQIFAFSGGRPELEIGARNIEAAKQLLRESRIRVDIDDTGGTTPRRASMVVGEGRLVVSRQAGREMSKVG